MTEDGFEHVPMTTEIYADSETFTAMTKPKYLTRTSPNADSYPDSEKWKLDVGEECNFCNEIADYFDNYTDIRNWISARAIRSLVARVAEFEHLETEKE